ncbi:hypothetical protein ABEW19_11060 [Paenibacillus illinoisensis]|uniref:hypothetical protein n=1 Tax=Paenibacillus illinoisensis TaxID=59845 RepID=UPI003D277693
MFDVYLSLPSIRKTCASVSAGFSVSFTFISAYDEMGGILNPASNHFEIPIDAGPVPVNTVVVAQDSEGKEFSLAQNDRVQLQEYIAVEGQEHVPIEVAILAAFFNLSVQVLVPSQGQELVPITGMEKNIVRLHIRCISK